MVDDRISARFWISAALALSPERSMPIMMSAPICRAIFTGKLLRMPPSTSTMPSVRTGAKRPGMDMVERMARLMEPACQTFAFPEAMSVATQAKGMGSLKKLVESL